jgi:catechol 1,2-dioxygenase
MTEAELTDVVLKGYGSTPDPRLREILHSLIAHAHAFVRETRLTEAEWLEGIKFLTAAGHMCDDKRQELILLSDVLGISSLVNMVSAGVPEGATESTVLGPFYVEGAPERQWGESVALRDSGAPAIIHGRVLGLDGKPLPGATIDVWQTDVSGMYDIQDPDQPEHNLRGRYRANERGEFQIRTIRPTSYPIPTDGPVGALVRKAGRHAWRPAHVHAIVAAPGYRTLVTHMFDAADPYLDSDVVFAVKASLIFEFTENKSAADAGRYGVEAPFFELAHDFVLARA